MSLSQVSVVTITIHEITATHFSQNTLHSLSEGFEGLT
jgi:hypothetical protein